MKKSYKRNSISFSLTILAIIDSFLVFRINPDGADSVTHAMLITAFIKVLTEGHRGPLIEVQLAEHLEFICSA